jgi:hypothetical protein
MFLVHDEEGLVPVGKHAVACRVRVWREKDRPSIVLISGMELPKRSVAFEGRVSCRFARLAWAELLRFSPTGFRYFEYSPDGELFEVHFDTIGVRERAIFARPLYQARSGAMFNKLVGAPVFLPPADVKAA